jgi:hypothetical protein
MRTRIYRVRERQTGAVHMLEATNPAQALRFMAEDRWEITPASAKDVAQHMATGGKVVNVRPIELSLDLSAIEAAP